MPSIRIITVALALALLVSSSFALESYHLDKRATKLDCTSCDSFVKGAVAVQTTPCSKFVQLAQCTATQKNLYFTCLNALLTSANLAGAQSGYTAADVNATITTTNQICDALASNNTDVINAFDASSNAAQCSNYASNPQVANLQAYTTACNAYNSKVGGASRSTEFKTAGGLALIVAGFFSLL
ncbi:hypothetical protein M427DRAFT_137920 [Gonapodya prolifera JEL478]|uniref:Uncharacterized protein n=1 Tax=Gonapodya prolifera (strain JEL478) TaxID=1344416 RepID=A0A139A551_GONPJ|nr:hypothetical protein M427DRAFT_137920 [Gonapodya prolifera JEL478]|eukprot:KXS11861.1 hypothetical protein M427DRAFT_137920 [Gonapodya prolifera JEL478]